jgi:hypothetical protein
MIQQVQFSAGGFEALYGDKLSSVLDITYKSFSENQTLLSLSRLGGNLSWSLGKEKWSIITGFRYRDNGLLVDQKETETNFNPSFTDLQTFITYAHSDQLFFNVLGAFSANTYRYEPLVRQTNFGTIEQPKALVVYYDGNEKDKYTALTGALKTTWIPNINNSYRLILSNYQTVETEHFDILAHYRLGDPNTSIGGDDLGEVTFTEGVGSQLTHGRNNYGAQIIDGKLRGKHIKGNHQLDWGIGYKREHIDDRLVEWEVVDSAGFSIRPPSGVITKDQTYSSFTGPLVPSMPFLKMNLNLVYNSGLPGGAPNYADPYDYSGRLRDYKRADLGVFYVVNDDNKSRVPFLKDLMIGFEIFNVFDVQNAITMNWVRDVSSKSQFGIPNYMTPRVFNLKLTAGF